MTDVPKDSVASEAKCLGEGDSADQYVSELTIVKTEDSDIDVSDMQNHLSINEAQSEHETVKGINTKVDTQNPTFSAKAVEALLIKQMEESGKMMKSLLSEFAQKFMSATPKVPIREGQVPPPKGGKERLCEEVLYDAGFSNGRKYSPDQCPIVDASFRKKQRWAEGMCTYEDRLTVALAELSPSEASIRIEENLRCAAQGMVAFLRAEENGPAIALKVQEIVDKIRKNPSHADVIKANETKAIIELQEYIKALNVKWATICGEPQVLQELKEARQALYDSGNISLESTTAHEIDVLKYVYPFSGMEAAVRPTFERWRHNWMVCHDAIMAAGATETDAFHYLLVAVVPGSPAHALVLRYQLSPSQCYSMALKALDNTYGDLVQIATNLIAPAPASKKPSEVVEDLLDFLDMKEDLMKINVSIGDILAQQKLLAMLPSVYKAEEAWPKWVEFALRDHAAANANRALSGANPGTADFNIGALYKMDSLKLFALWLDENYSPSSTEETPVSVSSCGSSQIPPPPRILKSGILAGCLCGAQDHKASTCRVVAAWKPSIYYKAAMQANVCRICSLHVFRKGDKCRYSCKTCGRPHPTNRHHHHKHDKKPSNQMKRQGYANGGGPLPKKFNKAAAEWKKNNQSPKSFARPCIDPTNMAQAFQSFLENNQTLNNMNVAKATRSLHDPSQI